MTAGRPAPPEDTGGIVLVRSGVSSRAIACLSRRVAVRRIGRGASVFRIKHPWRPAALIEVNAAAAQQSGALEEQRCEVFAAGLAASTVGDQWRSPAAPA